MKIRPKDPKSQKSKIIEILRGGGIGVMPTDTIYGLVGRALDEKAVERIYVVRKRTPSKPMIILISAVDDLNLLSVKSVSFATPFEARRREKSKFSVPTFVGTSRANDTDSTQEKLNKLWPGKVSIIFPCPDEKFYYLHRGSNSLAFRLPNDEYLRDLISQTGPLVAPSANLEGMPPA
ncbi:MAG: L-threonylcarbamoyladenylate synthase, partial [Candidatus Paceibacter sp.]|nr:L-threonylcarbamoyladenylate synthase [Candidatus Paceibacter sp.]